MLRSPVAFTDAIAGAIHKGERGAHGHKHQGIAMCVGIAREVCERFPLFEELREAPCLQGNKSVQAATEENFTKLVPFAVVARSFEGTEATENRIRVYGYVTGYFVNKSIAVPQIPKRIETMEGIEGVYEKVKAKKRQARDEAKSGGFGDSERQALKPDKREPAAAKVARALDKSDAAAHEPSKALGERLTVEAITKKCLLVNMPSKEELERYRDGSCRRGQRRRLDIVYRGTDADGLHVWEYVYGRDVGTNLSSHEDNDNDLDYEDEDEDAA
ncbi:hypothetical protein MPPM_4004 [Methylorubrum populi]|uniref:Uncharacterized protein n=1 Tax=Methylorubrum populi TaxID=223967 RepID=A0A160PGZ5_9HYPH|nr:hypothetical protein [Methylorubrum populi]BAU92609.1 hypothetical protein MPPM_4004 [Methylorubrum populi]